METGGIYCSETSKHNLEYLAEGVPCFYDADLDAYGFPEDYYGFLLCGAVPPVSDFFLGEIKPKELIDLDKVQYFSIASLFNDEQIVKFMVENIHSFRKI